MRNSLRHQHHEHDMVREVDPLGSKIPKSHALLNIPKKLFHYFKQILKFYLIITFVFR